MIYKNLSENFKIDENLYEKISDFITTSLGDNKLSYKVINDNFEISKSEFYCFLYQYLKKTDYLDECEPDENLLIKLTDFKKFNEYNLEYEDERDFVGTVILFFNQKSEISFKDQITKISSSDERRDYFQIQHVVSAVIPYMTLNNEDIIKILNHFVEQAGPDMTVGEVYRACTNFCKNNYKQGWELVELFKLEGNRKFLISALEGLSQIDFHKVYEFAWDNYNSEFKNELIRLFGLLKYTEERQITSILDLIKNEIDKTNDKDTLASIAHCLGHLYEQEFIKKYSLQNLLIKSMESVLEMEIPEVQYNIIRSLTFNKQSENEHKKRILKYFYNINSEHFGTMRLLTQVLRDIEDIEFFFNFLANWLMSHDNIENLDEFAYAYNHLYKINSELFINEFAKIVIHPIGKVRQKILSILEIVNLNDTNFDIWLNTLKSFATNQQIKFIKSLTIYSIDIQERLKLVFLLIKTHNEKIFSILLQNAIWAIQDYGSLVKEIILKSTNESVKMEYGFREEFLKYHDQITNQWKEKNTIKELDPTLNQTKMLNQFNDLFYKKHNEDLQKQVSNKSIFSNMVTNVQISRGFSFKSDNSEDITPMAKIEQSYVMPRTYFIFPEHYEYNMTHEINENWEGKNA